jgi:hypothetical protein
MSEEPDRGWFVRHYLAGIAAVGVLVAVAAVGDAAGPWGKTVAGCIFAGGMVAVVFYYRDRPRCHLHAFATGIGCLALVAVVAFFVFLFTAPYFMMPDSIAG